MSAWFVLLLALSVACDVTGQLCFKLGVAKLDSQSLQGFGFWRQAMFTPHLLVGIAIYALEFVIWLNILTLAPLSLAFPLASLNYCGVVLASRLILGEPVSARRWAGTALITVGVILVGGTA